MASVYRRKGKAGKWRVKFRDARGSWHEIEGVTDKAASKQMGDKLERLAALRRAGEPPTQELSTWLELLPTKTRTKLAAMGLLDSRAVGSAAPLKTHLPDYKAALLAGVATARQKRSATVKHAELVSMRIEAMLSGMGVTYLSELTPERVGDYLANRRSAVKNGLSVQTTNSYTQAIKSFCNWLVYSRRASSNPIAGVQRLEITDSARKLVRRALEHDEAARLLDTTRNGPERYGMTGEARYWLYRVALETGLRSGEIRALRRKNFDLEGDAPRVWLAGEHTKSRKLADLPLRSDTAAGLRGFLANKTPDAEAFTMPHPTDMAWVLRFDLEAAGVPIETDAGRVDFHALRHTCLTWLAGTAVPLKVLQDYARHSDPKLTMNLYAKRMAGSLEAAAASLPDLSGSAGQRARATGTDNRTAESGPTADGGARRATPKATPKPTRLSASCSNPVRGDVGARGAFVPPADTPSNTTNIGAKSRTVTQANATGADGNRTRQAQRQLRLNALSGRGSRCTRTRRVEDTESVRTAAPGRRPAG